MTNQHTATLTRLSWFALLLGALLTSLATWQVKQASETLAIKDFAFVAKQVSANLEGRLKAYALVLRGAAGFFDSSDKVTRQEWELYVSNLQLSEAMFAVSGINLAIRVPAGELAAHTASVQAEGFPEYKVWPSQKREHYTTLVYVSPFNTHNKKAFGYDMFTEPTRRQAMIQARDTGAPSLTGKVRLVSEDTDNPQAGALMFMPIYYTSTIPDTLAKRRAALIGWALSDLRMNNLMGDLLSQWQTQQEKTINLRIFDGLQENNEQLLYDDNPAAQAQPKSIFAQQHSIDFHGRSWLLNFDYANPNNVISYTSAWATFIGGLLLTSLVFFLIQSFTKTRVRAHILAQQLTEQIYLREQQLKVALQRLQTITSRIPGMVFEYRVSADGRKSFPYASEGIKHLYGISQQEVQEDATIMFTMVHANDLPNLISTIEESAANLTPWRYEYRIQHTDGSQHWLYGDAHPHKASDGSTTWYGLATDITERKQADIALRAANQQAVRFRQALDHVPSCIFMKDKDLHYTYANRATLELLGCNMTTLLGSGGEPFFTPEMSAQLRQTDLQVLKGELFQNEFSYTSPDGRSLSFLDVKAPIYDEEDNKTVVGMLGIATDITALKANEQKLEHQAHYDSLTKLPNRLMLADRLHQAMLQARRHQQSLAIVYLDLDGFKDINDSYGHTAGDLLLITVATRMKAAIREGDTSSFRGDEFVAILLDIANLSDSIPLLNRMLQAASRPVPLGKHRLQVTASLGVTFYPQPEALEPEQLIRQADQAMYQAKLAGKNRYYLFDTEQARYMRDHHQSIEHIHAALLADEFVLYYQPKVNMRSGAIIGVEALIRWQHPEQGLLAPSYFLPIIEEHKLVVDIGEWVIDSALQQILSWQQLGLTLPVSVNIAARHIRQPDFSAQLAKCLAKYPSVAPTLLELEVLETSTLGDLALVSQTLEECRALGVGLSLDDFGTGYSSLTYLKRLPTNIIKVDQSFIRDILEDPEDLAILDGILSLAKAFSRQVIAEGVETIAHGDTLLRMGCDLAQGYGIARPMPAEQIPTWVTDWLPAAHWSNIRRINRDELPLLYAGLEHNAWIDEMILTLQNQNESWPLFDASKSRLMHWLNSKPNIAPERLSRQNQLYEQIQQLATELQQQYQAGKSALLIEQLGTLCELQKQLVNELNICMNS